ncbi:DgyrCDS2468 [Dimorphilus gyrociliatus]|uniref:DgyrCDS2468 n=1 Tax=Dimorphilus gyrociliatus TaxID=2664684 RepID=A0A7I8VAE7_9ANNE|nr:DgyrCDS2468 [Dimorphilus gyrociliatus]
MKGKIKKIKKRCKQSDAVFIEISRNVSVNEALREKLENIKPPSLKKGKTTLKKTKCNKSDEMPVLTIENLRKMSKNNMPDVIIVGGAKKKNINN